MITRTDYSKLSDISMFSFLLSRKGERMIFFFIKRFLEARSQEARINSCMSAEGQKCQGHWKRKRKNKQTKTQSSGMRQNLRMCQDLCPVQADRSSPLGTSPVSIVNIFIDVKCDCPHVWLMQAWYEINWDIDLLIEEVVEYRLSKDKLNLLTVLNNLDCGDEIEPWMGGGGGRRVVVYYPCNNLLSCCDGILAVSTIKMCNQSKMQLEKQDRTNFVHHYPIVTASHTSTDAIPSCSLTLYPFKKSTKTCGGSMVSFLLLKLPDKCFDICFLSFYFILWSQAIYLWHSRLGLKIMKSHSYWYSLKFWKAILKKALRVVISPCKKNLFESCL
ncbi:hypothetical protein VP01_2154g1 [Puccinia sorghi]|uniref:Uncharacterized protein n=1 Tax=Puccinia sorghi TaxID=27349 RepID=A0A0L6V9M4_9BASI|nr:hypothetical protein VP01_2154g1 [Puccinia sorghi]